MKFSQLQYEKKFSKTIPHINIFCPIKLKANDCVFAKLKMFMPSESFMKQTLELKVNLWNLHFCSKQVRFKKWLFISFLDVEYSELNFDGLCTFSCKIIITSITSIVHGCQTGIQISK